MEVIHERCAGLDVHKGDGGGVCGVREHGEVGHEVRRFATTTAGLLELGDRLRQAGGTHVAMDATGGTGRHFLPGSGPFLRLVGVKCGCQRSEEEAD